MTKYIKVTLRWLQEFLERNVFGSFLQNMIWKYKHIYQRNWTKTSLESQDMPHREQLTSVIASLDNVESALEVGCAAAPNLRLLRDKLPHARLAGIDINRQAIREASDYFRSINDGDITLLSRKAHELDCFKQKSFDVVFSQAVLVCIPPSEINKVIKAMLRVSDILILNEYHLDGARNGFFDGGRWVYDYTAIIKQHSQDAVVSMQETVFKGGSWDTYGTLITVTAPLVETERNQ